MRDRSQQLLRFACVLLGALVLVQLARMVANVNPVAHLQIPTVPTLTKADAAGASKSTNAVPAQRGPRDSTNAAGSGVSSKETNAAAGLTSPKSVTNAAVTAQQTPTTNATPPVQAAKGTTNPVPNAEIVKTATNGAALASSSKPGTNASANARSPGGKDVTNKLDVARGPVPGNMPPGMGPGMPSGMPAKLPDLAPELLARLDRITDSEILGPVMRPLPMALLGIAGNIAFLRASNGQSGLVKEGENLGDLKLLRIGINRVLVEEEGQKKELMIYSGMGGESLLPK